MSNSPIREVAVNPLTFNPLAANLFSDDGLQIIDAKALLSGLNIILDTSLLTTIRSIENNGVQNAPDGVIQDPAGSAIGQPTLVGGGGSGAIYKKFTDLQPIPSIAEKSAIFNTSTGSGKRVLHSYSPHLLNSPTDAQARTKALEDMSNAFYNAMVAFHEQADKLGADGKTLNLVPLSAAIFANNFKDPTLNAPSGHLHPSYTLTAILIAAATFTGEIAQLPHTRIYYYDISAFTAAKAFLARLEN